MRDTVFFDLAILIGFVLLVSGLALWSIPLAIVVAGLQLISVGVAGYRRL